MPLVNRPTPPNDIQTDTDSLNVSFSTVFYPGAHVIAEDLVFSSLDLVHFYAHSFVFSGAAKHTFRPILSAPLSDPQYKATIISIPETSEVLDIIFHAIYNRSCLAHSPSFDAVVAAIDRMSVYEINPKDYLTPSSSLHELLLHFVPYHPFEVYALAAHYDVYDIAKATSSHLLAYSLDAISDEMAVRMGPVYLKRLLCLHANRSNSLKDTVMVPPTFHAPTKTCVYDDQRKIGRAWSLAAAYLIWDARPGLSVSSLEAAFRPLQDQISCHECRQVFSDRVNDAVREWSRVKYTI